MLVIENHWWVPYEGGWTDSMPIEYESAEKLICDLEDQFNKKVKEYGYKPQELEIEGHLIIVSSDVKTFRDLQLEIYTLEEWADKKSKHLI